VTVNIGPRKIGWYVGHWILSLFYPRILDETSQPEWQWNA
jgi:hypothetical protein